MARLPTCPFNPDLSPPPPGREGSRVSTLSSFDFQFHHKKGPRPPEEDGEDEFKEGEWHASLSVAATNRLRLKCACPLRDGALRGLLCKEGWPPAEGKVLRGERIPLPPPQGSWVLGRVVLQHIFQH